MPEGVKPAASLNIPEAVPVLDLLVTHPEYQAELQEKCRDFYEGGARFEKNKTKYLRGRQLDKYDPKYLAARLACASYTPHVAGAIDWLTAAAFQAEPQLLVMRPADKDAKPGAQPKEDPEARYWHGLNQNADGAGKDLAAIARSRLLQGMLHRRFYFGLSFPGAGQQFADLAQQQKAGAFDAKIYELDPHEVDDWSHDAAGELIWIRVHKVELERAAGSLVGPRTREVHTWTYIGQAEKVVLAAERKYDPDTGQAEDWQKGAKAARGETETYNTGMPIVAVHVPPGLGVMARLLSTAQAIFNREASLEFALDAAAYALPYIKTRRDLKEVLVSELHALKLNPDDNEGAGYLEPTGSSFAALKERIEELKMDLFQAIQAMALQASAKDDSGRQSGVAKFRDFGAITTLLSAFAAMLRDSLEKVVAKIKAARGETELNVAVTGLDKFDVQSLELKIKLADSFLKIPGIPDAARKWVLESTSLAMASDAPPATRETIRREAEKVEANPIDEVEINGAVAAGLLALYDEGLMDASEVRRKAGLTPDVPPGAKKRAAAQAVGLSAQREPKPSEIRSTKTLEVKPVEGKA